MALEAGTRLGHYEVVSSLGAEGMGEVYRTRDARLERDSELGERARIGGAEGRPLSLSFFSLGPSGALGAGTISTGLVRSV